MHISEEFSAIRTALVGDELPVGDRCGHHFQWALWRRAAAVAFQDERGRSLDGRRTAHQQAAAAHTQAEHRRAARCQRGTWRNQGQTRRNHQNERFHGFSVCTTSNTVLTTLKNGVHWIIFQFNPIVVTAPSPVNLYDNDGQYTFQLIALIDGHQIAQSPAVLKEPPIKSTASINPSSLTGKEGDVKTAVTTVTADPPLDGPAPLTPKVFIGDYRIRLTRSVQQPRLAPACR